MKALKLLGVAALTSLLVACGGDDMNSTLGEPIDGIDVGTAEDFAARVGAKVYFDFNMYDLKTEARDLLNVQAEWLNMYTDVNVTIEGHADERGTRAYNQGLGSRRANAVKTYLLERGVNANRIKVVSFGEEKPEAAGHDEESWAKNRRSVTVVAQ
ncbi:MAG: peptidoglycan-associated lipoprotein Pal [Alphaproteobacteria bacterium]|nr:peptidoglycan-associated lipoprotein Pal [Alphaproteobacteria bacterium]